MAIGMAARAKRFSPRSNLAKRALAAAYAGSCIARLYRAPKFTGLVMRQTSRKVEALHHLSATSSRLLSTPSASFSGPIANSQSR